jgi:outer membrane protein OmpA-like peptidoglycan-associated protein
MARRNRTFHLHLFLTLATALGSFSAVAVAQEEPAPRFDFFGGYAWTHPGGRVGTTPLNDIVRGWGAAATYNVNRFAGIELDGGGHYGDFADIHTLMIGPRLKFHTEQVSPFVHALLGWHRLSPVGFGNDNGIGIAVGGGFDIRLLRNLDLRLFQADYVWAHHNFFPLTTEKAEPSGARLRGGLVLKFGGGPPPAAPSASCSVEPREVLAGEPVRVTATPAGFSPKRTITYTWSTTGGTVEGTGATVTVNTGGLAPGNYNVTARLSDGREGTADCSASFTIKEPPPPPPPTISCSASQATVRQGESVTINCDATSPANRPLTFEWSTTGGRLSERRNTATLGTAGAPEGPITVTTTVRDDAGQTASASTRVNVEVPPPPPQASRLNEVQFTPNIARVDNTAKAILDDVALRLQREADAKAVIVGYSDTNERNALLLASRRAVNTKRYLVDEKGIDASRIEARTGVAGGTRAEIYLVPAGAVFDQPDTQVVDEKKLMAPPARKPVPRKPGARKPAPRRPPQ